MQDFFELHSYKENRVRGEKMTSRSQSQKVKKQQLAAALLPPKKSWKSDHILDSTLWEAILHYQSLGWCSSCELAQNHGLPLQGTHPVHCNCLVSCLFLLSGLWVHDMWDHMCHFTLTFEAHAWVMNKLMNKQISYSSVKNKPKNDLVEAP